MSVVILSGRSLFADGVASKLRQADPNMDLVVMNPRQPGVIENVVAAEPSVVIMDGTDSEMAKLCPLGVLVACLPTVKIIWLNPNREAVQLVTCEQRVAANVDDLIEMINQSWTGDGKDAH
jgi:hypothetical protein